MTRSARKRRWTPTEPRGADPPHRLTPKKLFRPPLTSGALRLSLSLALRARPEPITHNGSAHSESASAGSLSNADKLLELRKTYHRLSHQLTQASHHKQFIKKCLEDNLIPKDLRINLEPQAFMASKTDIKDQWDKKLAAMSKSLLQMLADHYLAVISGLVTEIDKVHHANTL